MPRHLAAVAVLLPFVLMPLVPDVAQAAGEPNFIHVTTTDDKREAFDQLCSLREALVNANTNAQFSPVINECPAGTSDGPDVIVLQSGMTYLLTLEGETNEAGDLDLLDDLVLAEGLVDIRIQTDGNVPATIRQTVPGQRVIEVTGANSNIELSNIVILNGDAQGQFGGGILSNSNSLLLDRVTLSTNKAKDGGGLAVNGNATLIDCRVMFNVSAVNGGGIWHANGHLLIQGGVVHKNTANLGGGIRSTGDLTIEQAAAITENNAAVQGGGINFLGESNNLLTIRDATIEANRAIDGAGVLLFHEANATPIAKIERTEFIDNRAQSSGGAIYNSSNLTVTESRFEGNSTEAGGGGGGAIYATQPLTLNNSSFINNGGSNTAGGGAVFAESDIDIHDTQFVLNHAHMGGGILLAQNPSATRVIQRSSFVENSATIQGGGINTLAGDLAIANTTFSGNTADSDGGSGIALMELANVTATNVTVVGSGSNSAILKFGDLTFKNSIVFSPTGKNCEVNPNNPLLLSLGNNLASDTSCFGLDDPSDKTGIDPMLATLADNGGNTQTHALLDGSPAIDAGDGIACANAPVDGVDQRGFARTAGLNCDIGAYEKAAGPIEQPVELFKDGFE